jgi:hypothetical protein
MYPFHSPGLIKPNSQGPEEQAFDGCPVEEAIYVDSQSDYQAIWLLREKGKSSERAIFVSSSGLTLTSSNGPDAGNLSRYSEALQTLRAAFFAKQLVSVTAHGSRITTIKILGYPCGG